MNLTADDYARIAAELQQTSPCCRGLRHIHAMARAKRTQQLRDEVRLCHMTAELCRALDEGIDDA
jgi:hypothetical protein